MQSEACKCMPSLNDFFHHTDAKSTITCVAGYADWQGIQSDGHSRKCRLQFCLPNRTGFQISGISCANDCFLSGKAMSLIIFQTINHHLHGLMHTTRSFVGIQLATLDLKHRFDVQNGPNGGTRSRNPAAFSSVLTAT